MQEWCARRDLNP